MLDGDIAISESLVPCVAPGRENAPPSIDALLLSLSWVLFGCDMIEGVFSSKALGTGCGQQSGVATDEGERMPRQNEAIA
jgi:hypothetical protein